MIRRWRTPPVADEEKPRGFDDFDLRLGDLMRGERATLGKSLLDVQRELKIKAAYIAAIENADPSAFETPGFIPGYVRSYARYLGMDPEWAYRSFCDEANFRPEHGLAGFGGGEAARPERREYAGDPLGNPNASFVPRADSVLAGIDPGALGSVAMLLALVGAIGFGGWSVLREIQQVDLAPVEHTPGVLADLDDFGAQNARIAEVTGGAGLNTPPPVEAIDRLYRPQALDVPVLVARDAPISTLDPGEVGTMAEPAAAPEVPRLADLPAAPEEPAPAPPPVRVLAEDAPEVVVFAVRASWVRVQAADGSVILEKTLDAGEQFVLPKTEQPARLRTGNAGSVYFAVGGTTYGPAGDSGMVVKNIALAGAALSEVYEVADLDRDADLGTYIAVAEAASLGQ